MSTVHALIEEARQHALAALQPSARDLEHGLELHRQALVVETYGFGPSGCDPERILNAIRSGAAGNALQDVIEEVALTSYVRNSAQWQDYQAMWEASGVTCIFRNAGEEGQEPLRILRRFAQFLYVTDQCRDFVAKALLPDDIRQAKREGRRCLVLTANGVPLVQDWHSVAEEFAYLHLFARMGCRMMHLTYNRRNMLGDGCAETANGGLSDFGRAAIAAMNREGVIVDVAHSGWQTSLEAAQVSTRPIVASHTTCADLWRHVRGKPDAVLRAIADGGGLIGICAIPGFLGGRGDLCALLDHLAHAVRTVGADHVGIGTDVGASLPQTESQRALEEDIAREYPKALRRNFQGLWPPDEPHEKPEWRQPHQRLSLAWVNFPYFTVGMVQRGFKDEEILKILGGNMLRVLGDALPETERQRVSA